MQCWGHRGAQAEKPGTCGPSSPSPEGSENTAARLWVYFQGEFSTPGTRGRFAAPVEPGSLPAAGLWRGAGTTQPPSARSTVTSLLVQLAAPHRQPTRTPVHATNSWINAYVLVSSLSLAGREENQEKSKHSEYPPAPTGSPPTAGRTGRPPHQHQHQLPVLTIIGASLILSLQKQQLPGGDSFRAPPPAHSSPPLPHHPGTHNGNAWLQPLLLHTFMAQNS